MHIPNKWIEDALVSALEGGSNYWYHMPGYKSKIDKWFPLKDGEKRPPSSVCIIESVITYGEVYPVCDIETGDLLGELSKANILRGIPLWFDHTMKLDDSIVFDAGMDASDADVFFQLIVMGEVVYG